jgi:hypothetical protein
MVDAWLVMKFKDTLYFIINCSNELLNCPVVFSKYVQVMTLQSKGVLLEIYSYHTPIIPNT